MRKRQLQVILRAIKGSGGIVSVIAKKLKVNYDTARRYIELNEETRTAFNDETNKIIDLAKQTVFQSIRDGDTGTARWLLATKGKHEGFTEKTEVEHSGDIKLSFDKQDKKL